MKKIFFGLTFIVIGLTANAQQLNLGLGGGIYSTWLINTNVSDQGDEVDFAATFGGQIGLNLTYYFKESLGITTGVFFTGHNQKYTGTILDSDYEVKTKLRYVDIPFLLRFGGGGKGAYFEFGPQFGFLMSAEETGEAAGTESPTFDVKDDFKGSSIAGVLGFGVDIDASENISITTGLRLGYGFNDITVEYKDEADLNANGESFADYFAHYDNKGKFDYKSTSRAFGGLFLGVMYKLPSGGSKSAPVPETK